jgi:2-methylcitrate dehydratase PrpD
MGIKTTKELAEYALDLKYGQLPSGLVAHVKDIVMGYMASTLGGSALPFGRIATRYAKAQATAALAGVSGGGFKTTLEAAALANATMAHATELEDVSFPDGLYSLTVLAPVFAIAEHRHMSGKAAIEGFVVGYDIASKLGVACADAGSKGWMLSATFASVGNAGAAARLFGHDLKQTICAMSLGASQGTGLVRQSGTGAHTFEAGFAARNGITAAILAGYGLDGSPTVLEGPGGMCDLVGSMPDFELVDGCRVAEVGIRKYPCCGLLQRTIDGMSDLVAEHNLRGEDLESIDVEVNHTFSMYAGFPEPQTAAQTRFSIHHAMAACFLERPVFLKSFTDEAAHDPAYMALRPKVRMIVHPEWEHGYFPQPALLTVRMKDGRVLKRECVFARGDAGHPISREDVTRKYQGGINFAGTLSAARAAEAAKLIESLEDVRDVSDIMNIFAFPDLLKQ